MADVKLHSTSLNTVKLLVRSVAVLVMVQVRSWPAAIVPEHSPAVVVSNATSPEVGDGMFSETLKEPAPNLTSVPVDEPLNSAGSGLLPVTVIVKSSGVNNDVPVTIFVTVSVASLVGVGGWIGVGVVVSFLGDVDGDTEGCGC